MPPFLYNRMSQPFCSFPPPPPLPQLGSLPLISGVQQMVMQRYENPIAVLPFSSSWQMPQPMMANPIQYAQQQPQQPMMINSMQIPAVQQQPMMVNSMQIPAVQQQPMMVNPIQFAQQQQQQQQPMMPMSAFEMMPSTQPLPGAGQSNMHSAPSMPFNISPPISSSMPHPFENNPAPSSATNYPMNAYPSTCRACPPAPPSLDIPVRGYCWIQHCSACHHVPAAADNLNSRPHGGRMTPLLRHPTVPQFIPDQSIQPQQQPHANAPVMMRPWLRKTPPIPPGAFLISDEYIDRNSVKRRSHRSSTQSKADSHHSTRKQRSSTEVSSPRSSLPPVVINHVRSKTLAKQNQLNNQPLVSKESPREKSAASVASTDTSDSLKSADYNKVKIYPIESKEKRIPPQLAAEARSVNIQYKYQSQELQSVYLINRYIKSSSEESTLKSNQDRYECCPTPPSEMSFSHALESGKYETQSKQEDDMLSCSSPMMFTNLMDKRIIIREFTASSPSTISTRSTISSDAAFSIIDKDSDSISTTSTVKAHSPTHDDITDETAVR
jgi:hypothetical protein